MKIQKWEREIIRELAKERKEIASLPEMQNRREAWTKHNDLLGDIPLIHFEMSTVGDGGFRYECKCESEEASALEYLLGESIANHKLIGDDRPVSDEFICTYRSGLVPFDMPVKKVHAEGVGFHIEPQIEDLDDLSLIKPSSTSFDLDGSKEWKVFVEEQIGDILDVKPGMNGLYVCLTNDIVHRMGMENMFVSMYDNPDGFHYLMERLSNDYIAYLKELEKRGMIVANNKCNGVAQGTFGFTKSLPDVATKTTDCWGFMDSQETVGISSDMFDEFFLPYYKNVADNFGLLSYGCCEPVHSFWEKSLSRLKNLRKISISPWCDEEFMGEKLRGGKTIYQRKPSPNFVGVGKDLDEAEFRKHIIQTLEAAKGCKLEITFRDVYNLEGNLGKPRRAVEIVREEIENRWQG